MKKIILILLTISLTLLTGCFQHNETDPYEAYLERTILYENNMTVQQCQNYPIYVSHNQNIITVDVRFGYARKIDILIQIYKNGNKYSMVEKNLTGLEQGEYTFDIYDLEMIKDLNLQNENYTFKIISYSYKVYKD